MTERKAGTVWLEWFPGLKIETWGTLCVGVSAKRKDNCIGLWVLLFRLEEVGDDLDDESWLALEDDVAAAGEEC